MKKTAHKLALIALLISICLSFTPAKASPLFESEEVIEMTLRADLILYAKDRYAKPEYHDALLIYDWNGKSYTAEVGIRARGRFRLDICDIPPIKMKIDKEHRNGLFEGQKSLKLVHQCKEIDPESVLKEYYVYKAYQLFTNMSLKVRLIKLTMVDENDKREPQTQYAFFIEDEDDMAERLEATVIAEDVDLDETSVDREQQTLLHVFNYMIANRDSRVEDRQNVEVITNPGGGFPVVVPYDFDNSGIVDAAYTKLKGDDEPTYFRRREFRPLCREEAEFQATFQHFQDLQEELFALYQESPYLSEATKKETLKYYKNFYRMIKKDKVVQEVFVESCGK